ncbi:glycoside hydrolase family 88 protein [Desertivirga xinjiangensis]|uniref:glycoside hydrolase family 88 protein n=1 Tax=Desertivirga xinjiangensis TaxID=539206 RepID=UPI00210878FF|nr:glycoside hydrolase family 88 protein [Pedobacter xinjiangensis]
MNFKFFVTLTLAVSLTVFSADAQSVNNLRPRKKILKLARARLEGAKSQYRYFMTQVPQDKMPRTLDKDGKLLLTDTGWWCSGFYPGSLLLLVKATGDQELYQESLRRLSLLEKEQYNKETHDLGFMMYCSFGLADKLAPSQRYKDIIVNSARSLASRFDTTVGCIRSWNSKTPGEFLVIIDNMMNLELLFAASRLSGDSTFHKIALRHANTTLTNHFRSDNSSWHVVNYDSETGAVRLKRTDQGAADASAWARGQAWGLYGYTMAYRETGNETYLDQANKIASFILSHSRYPKDGVPYWDFDAPGIPNTFRDASAASVIASVLIELAGYTSKNTGKQYLNAAENILLTLSSPAYTATERTNGGFLLKHSVGSIPHKSEVDVPLTYADYYYLEALSRYRGLVKTDKR